MKNCLIKTPVCGLLRTALCVALGIVCFASAPAMAGGHYEGGIYIPDGVCMDCDNDKNSDRPSNSSRSYNSEANERRAARNAIIDRYNAKVEEADAAWNTGNPREAARLYREALQQHEALGESKHSRNVRANIELCEKDADAYDAKKGGDAARAAGK